MEPNSGRKDEEKAIRIPINGVLDLHAFQPGEVADLVEEYLWACMRENIDSVRIIHGKGRGVLRRKVEKVLQESPLVAGFSVAAANRGGWGATVVNLKKKTGFEGPGWASFFEKVERGARGMRFSLSRQQAVQFAVHAREVLEWNRFAGVTAITELGEMAEKQFLDAIPLLEWIPKGARVVDIGSGGGFPGIPLKILRPDLHIDLVDGKRKKASLMKHVIRMLDLRGISVYHIRAEELAEKRVVGPGKYDVVVSKAVGSLERVVELCVPLIGSGGRILVMKGKSFEHEEARARAATQKTGLNMKSVGYLLPGSRIARKLVVLCRNRELI